MAHVNSHESLSSPSAITVTSTNTSCVGTHTPSSATVSTVNSHTGLIVSTSDTGNYIQIINICYYGNNSIKFYYKLFHINDS